MAAEQKQEEVPDHVNLRPRPLGHFHRLWIHASCRGVVTQAVMSVVGLILAVGGAVGWFRDVLPVGQHELVRLRPLEQRARPIAQTPRAVQNSSPVWRATVFVFRQRFILIRRASRAVFLAGLRWRLLHVCMGLLHTAASGIRLTCWPRPPYPPWLEPLAQLTAFNGTGFIVGLISRGVFSILVGLLFAVFCRCCHRDAPLSGQFHRPVPVVGVDLGDLETD